MIRPFTCVCILLAGGSGLYLYQVKHRAQLLDQQIARVQHQTDAVHERTRLLRAEWALLNDPSRLQALADQFLSLKPMAPSQFVQMASLGDRLPPPVAPGAVPAAPTDQEAPSVPVAEAPQAEPQAVASIAAPDQATSPESISSAEAAPVRTETAASSEPTPRKEIASAPAKTEQPVQRADRQPSSRTVAPARHERPVQTASVRAPSRPIMAPVVPAVAETSRVAARPERYPVSTREVAARAMQGMPVTAPMPMAGSALGVGRSTLAPPVPVGAAGAYR